MKREDQEKQALRDWVLRTSGHGDELTDDTPLFELGILKSIHVLDLILLLEELSGRSIDVEAIRPGAFGSIEALHRNFLTKEGSDAA